MGDFPPVAEGQNVPQPKPRMRDRRETDLLKDASGHESLYGVPTDS